MISLSKLQAVAEDAQQQSDNIGEHEWYSSQSLQMMKVGVFNAIVESDANFIAETTPEAMLSLIAEIRRLRAALSEIAAIELLGSDWNQIDHAKRALKIAREALKDIES